MPPVPKPKRSRRPTYLRQWRKFRSLSLDKASEMIGMSRENLGRIEKGEVPYNQDVLEPLADAYECEVADLLMRDPLDSQAMWTIWSQAKPAERARIVDVAKVLVDKSDDALDAAKQQHPRSQAQSRQTQGRRRA